MRKLNFLTLLLSLFVIVGCFSETEEQQVEVLSTEDAYKFLTQYLKTTDDGLYELRISATEAEKNHVSAEDYVEALNQVNRVNEFIQEQKNNGVKLAASVDKRSVTSSLLTRGIGDVVATITLTSSREESFSTGSYCHLNITAESSQLAWTIVVKSGSNSVRLDAYNGATTGDIYGGPNWTVKATSIENASQPIYVSFSNAGGCVYNDVFYEEGAVVPIYIDGKLVYGHVVNGTIVIEDFGIGW